MGMWLLKLYMFQLGGIIVKKIMNLFVCLFLLTGSQLCSAGWFDWLWGSQEQKSLLEKSLLDMNLKELLDVDVSDDDKEKLREIGKEALKESIRFDSGSYELGSLRSVSRTKRERRDNERRKENRELLLKKEIEEARKKVHEEEDTKEIIKYMNSSDGKEKGSFLSLIVYVRVKRAQREVYKKYSEQIEKEIELEKEKKKKEEEKKERRWCRKGTCLSETRFTNNEEPDQEEGEKKRGVFARIKAWFSRIKFEDDKDSFEDESEGYEDEQQEDEIIKDPELKRRSDKLFEYWDTQYD